jgi:hypothetical protein
MAVSQNDHRTVRTITWMLAVAAFTPAFAQDPQYHRIGHTGCQPISQRTGELGCWITAEASQGKLPRNQSTGICIRIRRAPLQRQKGDRMVRWSSR